MHEWNVRMGPQSGSVFVAIVLLRILRIDLAEFVHKRRKRTFSLWILNWNILIILSLFVLFAVP